MKQDAVLITGSSGFIASTLIRRLSPSYQLIGFDRAGAPHPPSGCKPIDVDLSSDESVRSGFLTVREKHGVQRFVSVVHLAAYYDFSGKPSSKYETITVHGTERLLRELQDFQVGQFVFSSTMLVHAPCQLNERITEQSLIDPKWDYPKSKARTEELIRVQKKQIPTVILRIAGVYDDLCHSIPIAHQMQRIYERRFEGHWFPGDISHGQSFIHVDDVADAIARVIERRRQLPSETTFLLGEPDTVSYEELQRSLGKLIHHQSWTTHYIPKPLAKAGAWLEQKLPAADEAFIKPWMIDLADEHYALDISHARSVLGWEPKRSLRASLPVIVAKLKANPARWYRENKLKPPSRVTHEMEDAKEAA